MNSQQAKQGGSVDKNTILNEQELLHGGIKSFGKGELRKSPLFSNEHVVLQQCNNKYRLTTLRQRRQWSKAGVDHSEWRARQACFLILCRATNGESHLLEGVKPPILGKVRW